MPKMFLWITGNLWALQHATLLIHCSSVPFGGGLRTLPFSLGYSRVRYPFQRSLTYSSGESSQLIVHSS